MQSFQIRPVNEDDHDWVVSLLKEHWGSAKIVTRGKVYQADILPGFVALLGDKRIGLVTYRIENKECEIISLNSLIIGAGSLLVDAAKIEAISFQCKRLWLITTNDNLGALRFYQKIGFVLKAVYPNALEESRKLKPEIPKMGIGGIPLRDEIELEMIL
jgi:N-acetylglutamate synthase-like GNAT family acetyltransferase